MVRYASGHNETEYNLQKMQITLAGLGLTAVWAQIGYIMPLRLQFVKDVYFWINHKKPYINNRQCLPHDCNKHNRMKQICNFHSGVKVLIAGNVTDNVKIFTLKYQELQWKTTLH